MYVRKSRTTTYIKVHLSVGFNGRRKNTSRVELPWWTNRSTRTGVGYLYKYNTDVSGAVAVEVLHIDGGVGSAYDLSRNTRGSHQAMVYSRRTLFYYFTCIEHRELKRSEFINLPHSIAVIFLKNFSRVFSHGVAAILDLLFRVRYIWIYQS